MTKRMSVVFPLLLALVAALVLPGGTVMAQDAGEVIIDGLNAPQGVLVDPDGAVWVVDSGVGGDTEIEAMGPDGQMATATVGNTSQIVRVDPDGTQTVVANLPSIFMADEAIGGARLALLDGELYVTSGAYIDSGDPDQQPMENAAAVLRVGEDGSLEEVAPTWRVEKRMNPDDTIIESHPYGLAAGPDGKLWVADAGGNTLLRINPDNGQVEVLTVFKPLPGVFPNPLRGGEMLTDPVPTGIAFDDEGNALVSLLSGAPFVPGSTKVMKVGSMGATSDYATGLTMLTDIARGPDGEFYAVQFAEFTDQGPTPNSGAIVRVVEGEGSEPVLEGLSFPTSISFDEAGDAYIAINGVGPPGSGAVIKVAGLASGEMGDAGSTEGQAADEGAAEEMELMDIVDTAAGNDDFSTLVAAVQAAGLADALKSEGPFTVFAPTNEAFEALPEGTLEELLADPAGELTDILLYHVVPGKAMAADVSDGLEVTTLQGDPLTFSVDGDTIKVNDATIVATDIEATNGVIHVIDSVLIPGAGEEMAGAGEEMTPEPTEEPAEEATPAPTEEMAEEATPTPTEEMAEEATPTPTEEVAEEAVTPEATEEPAEEATPAATEEPAEEATPTPTEEMAEEAVTAEPTEEPAEEATAVPAEEGKGAPETMPDTGAEQPGALPIVLVVLGVVGALVGGVFMRRRIA